MPEKYLIWISLFISLRGAGQFKACERMYMEARNLADGGRYETALNKLSAAKICNPQEQKYDSLIIEIYKDINRQKDLAIQARKEAEQALRRETEAKALESVARKEAVRQKDNVQKQLVTNYWNNTRTAVNQQDFLGALHYAAEAIAMSSDKDVSKNVMMDVDPCLPQVRLVHIISTGTNIKNAVFDPGRKFLVIIGKDSTARIWNAVTGKPESPVLKHDGEIISAAFSNDGRILLTASSGGTARIWDVPKATPSGVPIKVGRPFLGAALGADGKKVLTVDYYMNPVLWDAISGESTGRLLMHVESAAFNAAGNEIITINPDSTVRIWHSATTYQDLDKSLDSALAAKRDWNALSKQQIGAPMKHSGPVNTAVFKPDGKQVLTVSSNRRIRFWDRNTAEPVGNDIIPAFEVYSAVFSPDGKTVLTVNADLTARLWNATTHTAIGSPMKHEGEVTSAVYSSDSRYVLTASKDKTARLWDAATGEPLGTAMLHGAPVNSAVFSADGRQILTAGGDGFARLWELAPPRPKGPSVEYEYAGTNAVFSPDAKTVLSTGSGNHAYLWEAATGELAQAAFAEADVITSATFNMASFSPDGKKIVTGSSDHTVAIWLIATGKQTGVTMKHAGQVSSAVFSPDGSKVLTASYDSTAMIWDALTGKPLCGPMRHGGYVFSAVFSPDGKKILTACQDRTARLWNATTGKPEGSVLKHEGEVISAQFSHDGSRMLTASSDLTARVWETATGRPLGAAIKHESDVFGAVFSTDGKFILTASKDRSARMWNAATGRQVGPALVHAEAVSNAVFSPDGNKVLTASWNGSAYLWDVAGDFDLPASLFKMQAQVLTGCSFNTATNELEILNNERWHTLADAYTNLALEHYKQCLYPDFNLWSRFAADELATIRPRPVPPKKSDSEQAAILHNKGLLYSQNFNPAKAESAFLQALNIREALARQQPDLYELELAETQELLGSLYKATLRYTEAENLFLASFQTREKCNVRDRGKYLKLCTETGRNILQLYAAMIDSLKFEAFRTARFNKFNEVEQALQKLSDEDVLLKSDLFIFYANSAYYTLFAAKYASSEQLARQALQLYPDQTWVKTNLAHALLFQDRYNDAMKVYAELRPLHDDEERSFAELCVKDLEELARHGLTNKNCQRVIAFLKK